MPAPVDPVVPLNLRVPASVRKALKVFAANHEMTVVGVVLAAVDAYLKGHDKAGKPAKT
jgi:hypothetical protein